MNPTEAAALAERIEALEKRQRQLGRAVDENARCRRLRAALARAERRVRDKARPELAAIQGELRLSNQRLNDWSAMMANVSLLESGAIDRTRKVKMTLVPRITRPRHDSHSDWSSERVVIARYGLLEVWWWQSGKSWTDQLHGYRSFEGSLVTRNVADKSRTLGDELFKGGRLSRERIIAVAGKINTFFGIPDVAESIDWKQTLIIEDL